MKRMDRPTAHVSDGSLVGRCGRCGRANMGGISNALLFVPLKFVVDHFYTLLAKLEYNSFVDLSRDDLGVW